jgi:RNA polymerase sigma-70 factor, ECF subfamily
MLIFKRLIISCLKNYIDDVAHFYKTFKRLCIFKLIIKWVTQVSWLGRLGGRWNQIQKHFQKCTTLEAGISIFVQGIALCARILVFAGLTWHFLLVSVVLDVMAKTKQPVVGDGMVDLGKFRQLFEDHYRPLTVFAMRYVNGEDNAKEIVQQVFVRLWETRKTLVIEKCAKAFLYQSVKNACINHARSKHQQMNFTDDFSTLLLEDDVLERMIATEQLERIYQAIEQLPDRCRLIFKLSRLKQLHHSEIAKKLNISVKTVENQIGHALKKLSKVRHR